MTSRRAGRQGLFIELLTSALQAHSEHEAERRAPGRPAAKDEAERALLTQEAVESARDAYAAALALILVVRAELRGVACEPSHFWQLMRAAEHADSALQAQRAPPHLDPLLRQLSLSIRGFCSFLCDHRAEFSGFASHGSRPWLHEDLATEPELLWDDVVAALKAIEKGGDK